MSYVCPLCHCASHGAWTMLDHLGDEHATGINDIVEMGHGDFAQRLTEGLGQEPWEQIGQVPDEYAGLIALLQQLAPRRLP